MPFPEEVSYESNKFDLGRVNKINLADYFSVPGIYNIGISAVDEFKNESDLQLITVTLIEEVNMALVKSAVLNIPASGSPDIVGYKLYIEPAETPVSYASESFLLGDVDQVDLSLLPGFTTRDGRYNIGVSSVDDAGNESSMSVLDDIALDFVAPDPPGEITIERL